MNSSQENLLIQAIEENNLDGVKKLIAKKVNPDFRDSAGNTPLIYAAIVGNIEILNALIKGGGYVNSQDKYGNTALMMAAWEGHIEVVKFLVKEGADVNKSNYVTGDTALMRAAWSGHIEVAKVLIKAGADVNKRNYNCDTSLVYAARNGDIEVVEALIAKGADVNVRDCSDIKPSYIASLQNFNDPSFIALDANINYMDFKANTVLIQAALKGKIKIVQALILAGADVNIRNNDGSTALMLAAAAGHIEVVKDLIAAGADVNIKDVNGKTALDIINSASYISAESKAFLRELINLIKIVDLLVKDGETDISSLLPEELSIPQANIISSRYKALLLKSDIKSSYEEEISKLTNNLSISEELQKKLITILKEAENINPLKAVDLLIENIEADVKGLLSNKSKSDKVISEYKLKLLEKGINENIYQTYLDKISSNSTIPNEIKDRLTEIICLAKKDFDMFCSIIFTEILVINIFSAPLIGVIAEERKALYQKTELSLEDKEKIIDFYAQIRCKFTDQLRKYFDKKEEFTDKELSTLRKDIEYANIEFLKNNCSELLKNDYGDLIIDLNKKLLPKSLKDILSPVLKEYEEKFQEIHEDGPIAVDIPDSDTHVEVTGDAED